MDDGTTNIVHGNIAHTTQSNGFFSVGGGGGFSGSSSSGRKRRLKRIRAREQARQAQAIAAYNQTIAAQTAQYEATRIALENEHESRLSAVEQRIQSELRAVIPATNLDSRTPGVNAILRDLDRVNKLLAIKNAELQAQNTKAAAFFGKSPLGQSTEEYLNRLHELGSTLNAHQLWASSYDAAQSAKTLTETIRRLTDQSSALAAKKLQTETHWEQLRLKAEHTAKEIAERDAAQRADIKALRKIDEERRLKLIRSANTVAASMELAASGPILMTGAGLLAAETAAVALEVAIGDAIAELARVAAVRTGQVLGTFVTLMTYSPPLGNGELTAEQRNREFKALSVPADFLDLPESLDLRKIASEGGTVDIGYRLRSEPIVGGTKIYLAKTDGSTVPSAVNVVAGVLDPLSNTIQITGDGFSPTTLMLTTEPQGTTPTSPVNYTGFTLAAGQLPVETIPSGADTRFNDRLVVLPPHLGLGPIYVAFKTPWGNPHIATGAGQPTTTGLRDAIAQTQTALIPSRSADQLRGREFSSADELKAHLWKSIAKDRGLSGSLEELYIKRMKKGYAPFAAKSDWVGDWAKLDLRYIDPAVLEGDVYDLDAMRVVGPKGLAGTSPIASPITAWSPSGGLVSDVFDAVQKIFGENAASSSTWKPQVPPGSELIGPTQLPGTPAQVPVYQGGATTPVTPQIETLPSIDETNIGTGILWLPTDPGLPPQYILLRDRRDDPGIASGFGRPVSGTWLGEGTRRAGAPIPSQIADQLRGRDFSNFDRFREAFWQAVAADEELSKQFNISNLDSMQEGIASYAPKAEQAGKRRKFEIHHITSIAKGGDVYNVDNMAIMTPKAHISTHSSRAGEQE